MASWYERSPLTRDQRDLIRTLIDRAARVQINWTAEARCRGCGVEQIDPWTRAHRYVAGCRTCTDRKLRRFYRAREAA
jgi:hypothetical protein